MASDMPQEPAAPPAEGGDQPPPLYTEDDKQTAMFCHASALAGVLAVGTAMWVGPLLIWMMKKDTSNVVAFHAKEALNFQLNLLIPIVLLLFAGLLIGGAIGMFLLVLYVLVFGYGGVMAVIVGMKASDGNYLAYPTVIKLIQ